MAKILLPIVAFTAVAPGNTAICDLQLDRDYQTIFLKASANSGASGGTALTDISQIVENIRLVINGRTAREFTPDELRRLNGINGARYNGDDVLMLVIHGKQDWIWTPTGAGMFALNVAGMRALRLEVKLKTNINTINLTGFTSTTLPDTTIEPAKNIILQNKVDILQCPTIGLNTFRNIAFEGMVRRLHLFSANIIRARLLVQNTEIWNLTKAEQARFLYQNELVPDAAHYTIVWDDDQLPGEGIPASRLRDSMLELEVGAPGNVKLIQEYLAPIPAAA